MFVPRRYDRRDKWRRKGRGEKGEVTRVTLSPKIKPRPLEAGPAILPGRARFFILSTFSPPVRNSITLSAVNGTRQSPRILAQVCRRRQRGPRATQRRAGLYERDRWRRGRVRTSAGDVPPSCRSITPACTESACTRATLNNSSAICTVIAAFRLESLVINEITELPGDSRFPEYSPKTRAKTRRGEAERGEARNSEDEIWPERC